MSGKVSEAWLVVCDELERERVVQVSGIRANQGQNDELESPMVAGEHNGAQCHVGVEVRSAGEVN